MLHPPIYCTQTIINCTWTLDMYIYVHHACDLSYTVKFFLNIYVYAVLVNVQCTLYTVVFNPNYSLLHCTSNCPALYLQCTCYIIIIKWTRKTAGLLRRSHWSRGVYKSWGGGDMGLPSQKTGFFFLKSPPPHHW